MTPSSFEAVIRSVQKNLVCALDLTQQFNFNRLVMRSKRYHLTFQMHPVRKSTLHFIPFVDPTSGATFFLERAADGPHLE
jgi:hypothetical protein